MRIRTVVLILLLGAVAVLRLQPSPQPDRIRVVGLIKVKAERVADFEALIKRMTSRTKGNDRGNVRYEFFRTSAPLAPSLGSDKRSADYVFFEEWTDQGSLDAHLKWALPILQTEWKSLTEGTEFLRLAPI